MASCPTLVVITASGFNAPPQMWDKMASCPTLVAGGSDGRQYYNPGSRNPVQHSSDYTMFGDFNAKLRGLKHVYAYYVGTPSQPIKLYQPYNNRECLHCHLGARGFEESEAHTKDPEVMSRIKLNQLSCSTSECHNIVHNVQQLKEATFWKEPSK